MANFGEADCSDLNGFDAGVCEAFAEALLAGLPDFFATALPAFAAGFFAGAFEPPRPALAVVAFWAAFLAIVLDGFVEDFLRVFLDIRLPFVAFRGSTNRVMRVSSRMPGFDPIAGQV